GRRGPMIGVSSLRGEEVSFPNTTDPVELVEWISQRLDQEWTPLGLLAVLLPPGHAAFPVIDNDTLQSLDALIGLEALHSRLGPLLDTPAADPDSSQDEHRARILQALRVHRGNTPGSG
ncbi:hypothetical protein ACH49J_09255, partial [Streptomyces niveus]